MGTTLLGGHRAAHPDPETPAASLRHPALGIGGRAQPHRRRAGTSLTQSRLPL